MRPLSTFDSANYVYTLDTSDSVNSKKGFSLALAIENSWFYGKPQYRQSIDFFFAFTLL